MPARRLRRLLEPIIVAALTLSAGCRRPDLSPPTEDGAAVTEPAGLPAYHHLPSPAVVDAVRELQGSLPGVEVDISLYTGEVVAIVGPSLSGAGSRTPLAPAIGRNREQLGAALGGFVQNHKALFHLTDAGSELAASVQPPVIDEEGGPVGLSLDRYFKGVRVHGHFVTGLFDARGQLQALTAHMLPMGDIETEPFLNEDDAAESLRSATTTLLVETADGQGTAELAADEYLTDADAIATELVILPLASGRATPARTAASVDGRLAYEVRFQKGARSFIGWVDALSAEVIRFDEVTQTIDATCTNGATSAWLSCSRYEGARAGTFQPIPNDEWTRSGTTVEKTGVDEIGRLRRIYTTEYNGLSFLGVSGHNLAREGSTIRWLAPDSTLTVENRFPEGSFTTWLKDLSMCLPEDGSSQAWSSDAALCETSEHRQATALVDHTISVLDWWQARGWRGWNGRGASIKLAVGSIGKSPGELNALESSNPQGIPPYTSIVVTRGRSERSQQYAGSSLDVVAHEFTHAVIKATSLLRYQDEPGAINESLADIMGTAVDSVGDDFNHDGIVGLEIGERFRSMKSPSSLNQPECYVGASNECPEFTPREENTTCANLTPPFRGYCSALVLNENDHMYDIADSGGVHINSGILNKAHALLVTGGPFNKVEIPRLGMSNTEAILRKTNERLLISPYVSFETFALGVVAGCRLMESSGCDAFRAAYTAVEVLGRPRHPILRAVWATTLDPTPDLNDTGDAFRIRVVNDSYDPILKRKIRVAVGRYIYPLDPPEPQELKEEATILNDFSEEATGFHAELQPGESLDLLIRIAPGARANDRYVARVLSPNASLRKIYPHLTDVRLPIRGARPGR